jgi:hypothetical protein
MFMTIGSSQIWTSARASAAMITADIEEGILEFLYSFSCRFLMTLVINID